MQNQAETPPHDWDSALFCAQGRRAASNPATPGFGDPSRLAQLRGWIRGETHQSVRQSAVYSASHAKGCWGRIVFGRPRSRAKRRSSSSSAPSSLCPARAIDCASSAPFRLVCLTRRAVGSELHGLAAGVVELRAHVGRDEVAPTRSRSNPVSLQNLRVLCRRQSAGYSPRSRDVAAALLADRPLDRDVGDLDASTGSATPAVRSRRRRRSLSGTRSITPFEITTPKLSSSNGSRTISPPTKSNVGRSRRRGGALHGS